MWVARRQWRRRWVLGRKHAVLLLKRLLGRPQLLLLVGRRAVAGERLLLVGVVVLGVVGEVVGVWGRVRRELLLMRLCMPRAEHRCRRGPGAGALRARAA